MGTAIAALITDVLAGEPPDSLHPTVWMGRWIAAGRTRRRSAAPLPSLAEGALIVGGGLAAASISAWLVSTAIQRAPSRGRRILRGLALKPALSLRPLVDAASEVQYLLECRRLDDARQTLARHLVSRDTRALFPSEVAGAAIESVAENLSDSFIAPLLAFRIGGLGAAYGYRLINTADAMLGYRTDELEWFGKGAARGDDIANLLPSRVTAALICSTAFVAGGSSRAAARVALRDARRTPSPNAGWPMAAMAGALGVRLTKRDVYSLNGGARRARPADIGRSCRIVLAAASLAALAVDLL